MPQKLAIEIAGIMNWWMSAHRRGFSGSDCAGSGHVAVRSCTFHAAVWRGELTDEDIQAAIKILQKFLLGKFSRRWARALLDNNNRNSRNLRQQQSPRGSLGATGDWIWDCLTDQNGVAAGRKRFRCIHGQFCPRLKQDRQEVLSQLGKSRRSMAG